MGGGSGAGNQTHTNDDDDSDGDDSDDGDGDDGGDGVDDDGDDGDDDDAVHLNPYSSPLITSGARYSAVPTRLSALSFFPNSLEKGILCCP